jgi:hypothetical protein
MRISASGYFRDHGSRVLAEGELADTDVTMNEHLFPKMGFRIQYKDSGLGDRYISIATRINVSMQGNYKLEVRFTMSDILKIFWICFKDKALRTVFSEVEGEISVI